MLTDIVAKYVAEGTLQGAPAATTTRRSSTGGGEGPLAPVLQAAMDLLRAETQVRRDKTRSHSAPLTQWTTFHSALPPP